jgi:hypothetical protein
MSLPERRAMVERPGEDLSVRRQCTLLNLARSGVYRPEPVTSADDLAMMRRIDELHLKWPFYGSRRMVFELNQAATASIASNGGCGRQVDATAGLPPASEYPVRSHTYASCQITTLPLITDRRDR